MSLQPDCVKYLRNAPQGLALEFGVMGGRSTRLLAETGRLIYGFDWWRGLPHDWGDHESGDRRRSFACAKPDDLPANVILIDGLFSDTLERFLGENDGPVGFAHIDCDIYTSCAHVLHCLSLRWAPGAVIVFDDIRQEVVGERIPGERRAWNKHNAGWSLLEQTHSAGEVWKKS
jgi:hypothetical protein